MLTCQLERFAEAALTGALSLEIPVASNFIVGEREQALARWCYDMAELMMEEARKREDEQREDRRDPIPTPNPPGR